MADKHKGDGKTVRWLVWSVAAGLVLIAIGAMVLIAPVFQLSYAPTGSGTVAAAAATPAPATSGWPEQPQWGEDVPPSGGQTTHGTAPDGGI